MVFKILCVLVLWTEVASALEGLIIQYDTIRFHYNTMLSGFLILLIIIWEYRMISQYTWTVVGNVLINISFSNILPTLILPKKISPKLSGWFLAAVSVDGGKGCNQPTEHCANCLFIYVIIYSIYSEFIRR